MSESDPVYLFGLILGKKKPSGWRVNGAHRYVWARLLNQQYEG